MATIKENLEQRIERIRRQTEEIEKKHREAEADRLMALNQNAMVKINQPLNDDDWPKAHKYDKIDFTYDVPFKKTGEIQNLKDDVKAKRAYKKFPEGEGPPPDPVYNFLADDERGDDARKIDKKNLKEKTFNNNFKNKDLSKRGQQNGNFRNGRSQLQQQHQKTQQQSTEQRSSKFNTQIEQWRSNDGKDKLNANSNDNNSAFNKKSPKHNTANNNKNYSTSGDLHLNNKINECMIEKRGNITVSISQTGEVKSVKLSSAPAIGSGRVGPRQMSKPQFQVIENETTHQNHANIQTQSIEMNSNIQRSQNYKNNNNQNVPLLKVYSTPKNPQHSIIPSNLQKSPVKDRRDYQNNPKKIGSINTSQHLQNPELIFEPLKASIIPTSKPESNISNNILKQSSVTEGQLIPEVLAVVAEKLSNKPEFKRQSVQDRLLKIRQQNIDELNDVNDNNCNDTTKNNVVPCN